MGWLPALVEKISSLYGVTILLIVMIVGYILLRTGRLQIKTKSVRLGKTNIDENDLSKFLNLQKIKSFKNLMKTITRILVEVN